MDNKYFNDMRGKGGKALKPTAKTGSRYKDSKRRYSKLVIKGRFAQNTVSERIQHISNAFKYSILCKSPNL